MLLKENLACCVVNARAVEGANLSSSFIPSSSIISLLTQHPVVAHQRAKLCCWGQYCILGFHCSSSLAVFLLCTKSTCVKTTNWLVPERNFRNHFSTWQKSATRLFYFGLKDYFQNFRQNNINVHPFQPRELFESRKGDSFDSVFWIFSLHFLQFRFFFFFFFFHDQSSYHKFASKARTRGKPCLRSFHPETFLHCRLFFSPEQPRQALTRTMMPLNLIGFRFGRFHSWPYRANFILPFCFSSMQFFFHFLSEPVFDFSDLFVLSYFFLSYHTQSVTAFISKAF